jgi:hypothetical protein
MFHTVLTSCTYCTYIPLQIEQRVGVAAIGGIQQIMCLPIILIVIPPCDCIVRLKCKYWREYRGNRCKSGKKYSYWYKL